MDRIKFYLHKSRLILITDYSNLNPEQVLIVMEEAVSTIRRQEPKSLWVCADFTNTKIEFKTHMIPFKEYMIGNKPFVKYAAVVGLSPLIRKFYQLLMMMTGRNWPVLENREDAYNWLAEQK
ncbi:MAG: hypothetical protein HQK49_14320 [Oligoflexia bacterium]|nr:hypothetical protein [Oligoflexia bacterium]